MGSTFRLSWIIFALSVISGIAAFVSSAHEIVLPLGSSGKVVVISPYIYLLYPAVITFVMTLATSVSRAKPHMRDTRFRNVVLFGTVAVLSICQIRQYAILHGLQSTPRDFLPFVGFLAGLLLVVAGNYLPKAVREDSVDLPKPWSYFFSIPWTLPFGYLFGVRTWWTLASDQVWNRTQRLAGRLWIVSGIGFIIAPWIASPAEFRAVILASLVLNILIPVFYSFLIRHAAEPA